MLTIVVAFKDASIEQIEGVTQWDLRRDGHLLAWNDSNELVAERDDVASAVPGPLGR